MRLLGWSLIGFGAILLLLPLPLGLPLVIIGLGVLGRSSNHARRRILLASRRLPRRLAWLGSIIRRQLRARPFKR